MVVFAICPNARVDDAGAIFDAYLDLGEDIPTGAYVEAVKRLAKTWTWPNPPQPGDIRKVAAKLLLELRLWLREQKQLEVAARAMQDAISPAQAQAIVGQLEAIGPPEDPYELIGWKFSLALHRAAARRGELTTIEGGKS